MSAADGAAAASTAAAANAGSAERLLDAAIALGVREGAGALSLQAIGTAAGMSKALLLYHFRDKATVLRLVRERLDGRAASRLLLAATAADAMAAWRALAHDEVKRGELALFSALALEVATGAASNAATPRSQRDEPASRLAVAVLRSVGLTPRVPTRFLGRVLLRHLDGLAAAAAHRPFGAEEIEAELDAFALALLGLGR